MLFYFDEYFEDLFKGRIIDPQSFSSPGCVRTRPGGEILREDVLPALRICKVKFAVAPSRLSRQNRHMTF